MEPPANAQPGMKVLLEGLPASKEVTKEINLRSKSNKWDAAQPVFIWLNDSWSRNYMLIWMEKLYIRVIIW